MTLHPLAPVGALFALTVWPLLAALLIFLIPTARQRTSALTFAVAGALLTPFAVMAMPGTDAFAAVCSCAVAVIPLLLPVGEDRVGRLLPFLVTGCALMALNVHSALAITALCGAGTVLLALREGRGTQRAVFVWNMARTRLCGVALAALGAGLLPMQRQSPLGPVLLGIGLCMMAGLGPSPAPRGGAALMETGPRFAAIALMMRLNGQPMVHLLILVAGFASLLLAVTMRGQRSALPLLSALGAIGAAKGEGAAIVLFLITALGATTLETGSCVAERASIFRGQAPWPVFGALVILGRSLDAGLLMFLIACVAFELRHLPTVGLVSFSGFSRRAGDRETGWIAGCVETGLLFCGLATPFLLGWHPVLEWRP